MVMVRFTVAAAVLATAGGLLALAAEEPAPYRTVVAEGVGQTVEDARKDAVRNAVRQAVGALIDAETLVQNDQVIKDEVLTYSNALVKTYKEVDKPKRDGDLYRVTIVAAVENLGLEKKVARAKESFQKVDSAGLYAQLLKELYGEQAQQQIDSERRQAARAMMERLLDGYPLNCMEAALDGEPKVLKREGDKVTFQVRVLLKPDVKAFDDFATRLTARLEKMARDKDEFGIKAEVKKDDRGEYLQFNPDWGELMGRRFEADGRYRSKGTCVVAVNTSRVKANDRTVWKYYELDDTVRYPLASAASCVLTLKLWWVDKDGRAKDTEQIPAVAEVGDKHMASLVVPGAGNRFIPQGDFRGFCKPMYDFLVQEEEADRPDTRLYLLSPYFQLPAFGSFYVPQAVVTREYTLSVGDVKELKGFKCELRFEDKDYRDLPPRVPPEKK
jgi:hypothetical protein